MPLDENWTGLICRLSMFPSVTSLGSTPLAFRPDVEITELSGIDSETEEQTETPLDTSTSYAG